MHISYLKQAFELAEIRSGCCAPNPAVGALVVKDHQILAKGYHWKSGSPHAEVEVLSQLSMEQTQGSTLYVTLEPCCHWGKTPPCTDFIISRGVTQVFFAVTDPNPEVAGKGIAQLEEAGINCQKISLAEFDHFYRAYYFWRQYQKPWVTAKIALSLDGKIAGFSGQRVAITGDALQKFTHQQRKRHDAILTTAKTIISDNPKLNVRLPEEEFGKPLYILDSNLAIPSDAEIFSTATSVTLFYQEQLDENRIKKFTDRGITCIPLPNASGFLSLPQALDCIAQAGMHAVWVEAGGQCLQSLIRENLIQQAFIYVAPKLLGAQAKAAFDSNYDIFASAKCYRWQQLGRDAVCEIEWEN